MLSGCKIGSGSRSRFTGGPPREDMGQLVKLRDNSMMFTNVNGMYGSLHFIYMHWYHDIAQVIIFKGVTDALELNRQLQL